MITQFFGLNGEILRRGRLLFSTSALLICLLPLLLLFCGKAKPQKPEIKLMVSEKFREIFSDFKPAYARLEIPVLLAEMVKRSDRVCRALHDKVPGRTEVFRKYSKELWTPKFNAFLSEIIAGCYNFYTMNDLAADAAFKRVAEYYPQQDKDCYSVGFVQLYLMHSIIKCNKLTSIDIDWQILYLHFQVLAKLYLGQPLIFKDLDVRWSANFPDEGKIRPREYELTVDSFCYWQTRPACRQAFQNFAALFAKIQQIDLQLSFLHDIKLEPLSPISVLYVSNAIDPGYTPKNQFEILLKTLTNVRDKKHKTVIVYHGGGNFQFGIYEIMVSPNGEPVVVTKCRNNFEWSKYYKDRPGVKYRTHLDILSTTQNPAACAI